MGEKPQPYTDHAFKTRLAEVIGGAVLLSGAAAAAGYGIHRARASARERLEKQGVLFTQDVPLAPDDQNQPELQTPDQDPSDN